MHAWPSFTFTTFFLVLIEMLQFGTFVYIVHVETMYGKKKKGCELYYWNLYTIAILRTQKGTVRFPKSPLTTDFNECVWC